MSVPPLSAPRSVAAPQRRSRSRRLWSRVALLSGVGLTLILGAGAFGSRSGAATATVDAASVSGFGTVLTNAQGLALYTFASDHGTTSACTGTCAQVWPPLTVPASTTPTAGPGVTGTVGVAVQSDGAYQVTYNGSLIYTFASDIPDQVSGNGIGGFTVVKLAAASTPTTAAPAPAAPVTTAPGITVPPTTPAAGTPTPAAPPQASASSSGASSPASPSVAATGGAAPAPDTLAFTGPGPGLAWLAAVGATLVIVSLVMLWLVGDRPRRRFIAEQEAKRAGLWLLGR